jgi:hypothetical protein
LGLFKAKKSVEELQRDLDKARTALKEVMNATDEECDVIVTREMQKRSDRGLNEQEALEGTVRYLRAQIRGEEMSDAPTFDGYVVGDRGLRDSVWYIRREALAAYERNPSQAVKDELVKVDDDGNPVVLDPREKKFGRPNPRKGKELRHEYKRFQYGIATKRPDGKAKIFRLSTRDDVAQFEQPPLFEPVSFRANVRTDAGELELNHSNRTKFRKSGKKDMPSVVDVFESNMFDKYIYKLEEMDDATQMCSDDWTYFIVTMGTVLSVGSKSSRGSIPVTIYDESLTDTTVTVWVNEHLTDLVNFGPGTLLVVTGKAKKSEYQGSIYYSISADGIYPIPQYTEPLEDEYSEDEEVEEED